MKNTPETLPDEEALLDELSPIEYEALRWTVRQGDGLSLDEEQQLQQWLAADAQHHAAFAEMQGISGAIDALPIEHTAQLQASVALSNAAQTTSLHSSASPHAHEKPAPASCTQVRRRKAPYSAIFASTLLVMGIASWFGWQHWQNQLVFSNQYATIAGQQITADLPDGSQIVLDTDSQLSVNLYRNRREVGLQQGQALFKVEADPKRPFEVQAATTRITVVGTQFSVRHIPELDGSNVEVQVQQGKVRVTSQTGSSTSVNAKPQTATLTAGQAITSTAQDGLSPIVHIQADDFASWQHQRLNFENASLNRIVAELARYGHHPIRLQNEATGQMRITASIDLQNIDGFLQALPQVLPVRIVKQGDATVVRQR